MPGSRLDHDAAESPESRLIGAPIQSAKEKAAKANPIVYIPAMGKDLPPFLIVHGSEDPAVPMNQSELLYAALQKAGIAPVHLHIIEGAGHGKGFGGPEIEEMVVAFFKENLKAGSGTATGTDSASAVPKGELATKTRSKAVAERTLAGGGNEQRKTTPITPSPASTPGTAPAQAGARPRLTWEEVCRREGIQSDGQVSKDKFKGPAPLFSRLDRNGDGILTKTDFETGER